MKLAIAQSEIHFEDQTYQLQNAATWIEQAAAHGADCIVFPEMSFTGFSMHIDKLAAFGIEAASTMQSLAKENHIAIGFGWVSKEKNGKGKNHYSLLDATGNTLLDYTKIHPFSYGKEDQYFQGGRQIVSAQLCGIPVSALICYDLRFPEVFRFAAQQASLIFVPANWLERRSAHWNILLRARAIENQVYILGINCVGTQQNYHFVGGSCLINPEGEVIAACGKEEQLLFAEINNDIDVFRTVFPTYRDMQLPFYAGLYAENTAVQKDKNISE